MVHKTFKNTYTSPPPHPRSTSILIPAVPMSARSDSLPRMRLMRAVHIALLGALVTVAAAVGVGASGASAATRIDFQPESLSVLKVQLGNHEVHALTFHPTPAPGHVHVSMNDTRHFTVVYATGEQAHLIALAIADGTRYAVATVKPRPTATTHHTLRYIAGGIVIVVIVVVVAVLLVDRRRKLGEGGGDEELAGDAREERT
jgi:hypothetical protein